MKNFFTVVVAVTVFGVTANSSPLSTTTTGLGLFRLNLYAIGSNNSAYLVDGTLTQYDSTFSNDIDGFDALKMFNPGENIGMERGGYVLIGEKRHIIETNDSIFFKIWNLRTITYRMVFITSNLNQPGRIGLLQDDYLHTSSPLNLNDSTLINFSVTSDPASRASDRFRVIFVTAGFSPLPLTFKYLQAFEKNNVVHVNWNTGNESNVDRFKIERANGDKFFPISADIIADKEAFNYYEWKDPNPLEGNNYYRITSTNTDGRVQYSNIVKVVVEKGNSNIKVYPIPATASNLKLQITNAPAGIYEINMLNTVGQLIFSQSISHSEGTSVQSLNPPRNLPKGIYRLKIKSPSEGEKIINIVL